MNPCLACTAYLVSFVALLVFVWRFNQTGDYLALYSAIAAFASMAVLRGYLPKRGGRS